MLGPIALNQTISDVIDAHAERTPDVPVIMSHGRAPLSYLRLAQEIKAVRTTLNGWGIGRGDRVALIIGSRPEALVAYLCVANAATVIPLNPKSTSDELTVALLQTKADAAIVSEGLAVAETVTRDLVRTVFQLCRRKSDAVGLFDLTGGTALPTARSGLPESADIAMIQLTSGTTSMPKAVPLSHALVTRRGACEMAALGLTADDRCLNFRPAHLHGALNAGLMASIAAGGGVVVPEDFDADAFYRDIRDTGVTWYTGGPVYHEALLERAPFYRETIERSRLRLIRSASYSLSPDLMNKLEATFGVICLERYGGCESGLICRNPPPPAARKPGTSGVSFDNEVVVLDNDGCALPLEAQGEIAVRGPNVFAGYEDDAEATASVLVDGWYRTGDLGRFDEDGYLIISGRISEIINCGGQKVSPNEVETVLALHENVGDCICFPIPHRTLGHVVGAAVAPRDGSEFDETRLRKHIRAHLAQYKVPNLIIKCEEIPRGPGGKLQRLKAAEHLGLVKVPPPQSSRPMPETATPKRTALMTALATLWCEILQLDGIGDDDNFVLMGGDSLQAARLLMEVEDVFGVALPVDIVFGEGATVASLAVEIKAARGR